MAADAHEEVRIGEELRMQRYFLGEAGSREREETRLHLGTCAHCRNLLATLEEEKRTFLLKHPFREFAKRLPEDLKALKFAVAIGVTLAAGATNDKFAVSVMHPVTYIFWMFLLF